MLTCQQLAEVVTDYLEGKMNFADRIMFQLHVGMCKHCRAYLNQMKQTVELVAATGKIEAEPMPDDVQAELMHRFRNWKTNKQ